MVGKEELVYPGVTKSFSISSPGTYVVKGIDKGTGKQIFTNKVVIQ